MRKLKRMLLRSGLPVTANNRKLRALKNRHRGEKGFFIGMGPSLGVEDLDLTRGGVSFACNKVFLCYDQTDWRPDYYSVIDIKVAENNRDAIGALEGTKIFDVSVKPELGHIEDAIWVNGGLSDAEGRPVFNDDPFRGFGAGATVIFFQLQLAWFMGIREFYLMGLDFSFKIPQKRAGDSIHGEVLQNEDEVNHFHPDYRKKNETWTMPDLDKQKEAFAAARDFIEGRGGRIRNCSRKTELDVFECESLERVAERDAEA